MDQEKALLLLKFDVNGYKGGSIMTWPFAVLIFLSFEIKFNIDTFHQSVVKFVRTCIEYLKEFAKGRQI